MPLYRSYTRGSSALNDEDITTAPDDNKHYQGQRTAYHQCPPPPPRHQALSRGPGRLNLVMLTTPPQESASAAAAVEGVSTTDTG